MAKRKKESLAVEIKEMIAGRTPENLAGPGCSPARHDHVENVMRLVRWGHPQLAADHLLFPELNGSLSEIMGGVLRRINVEFTCAAPDRGDSTEARTEKCRFRFHAYEFLLETALNYYGHESRALDHEEKSQCLDKIYITIQSLEEFETSDYGEAIISREAVRNILSGMKLVQGGASMVAKSAARIEKEMSRTGSPSCEFLDAAEEEILSNIYYRMVAAEYCKFGNDYALGLRWLRHLGFEQVSTNPVLAAKAYEDDPTVEARFKAGVVNEPDFAAWSEAPEKYADEITLCATLYALWDNLHVYRPAFYNLADSTGGGVVSFQLNPNLAHRAEESVRDAMRALEAASEDLKVYDEYLLAGYEGYHDHGRPNMVIKVAASHPAAREIAYKINSLGLGSNITVVYTVSQQVTLILDELAGMATAIQRGIRPTQLYMTNMGGRLESHLREVVLESMFARLKVKMGEKKALDRLLALAKANGSLAKVKAAGAFDEKVAAAVSYGVQKTIDANAQRALKEVASASVLAQWEDDISKAGTLVARRVWSIFFSEKNREKWIVFMVENFDVDPNEAAFILSRLNYLPASKRKPEDTYWTLTHDNMVHTEFGNHQENVQAMSWEKDFSILDYIESIRDSFPADVVERLNVIPDFPVAYEINKDIAELFKKAGIEGDFGARGHKPAQWGEFGSVMKTSAEFRAAYDNFKNYVLKVFKEVD